MGKRTTSVMMLTALLGVGAVSAGFGPAPTTSTAAQAPLAEDWAKVLDERSPSLVTVKFVLKFEPAGEQQETEISALVIDSKGLLLASNFQTGGFPPLIQARMSGMTATPTEMKVLIGDDVEGVPAKLIARDSELDLAWIQIDESAGKTYTAVDLSKNTKPAVGDTLLTINHLGKFFDRAPVIKTTRMGGSTKKPRALYIPADNAIAGEFGTPVFATDGSIVGFTAMQLPEAEDVEGGDTAREYMTAVILPADALVRATKRALESAAANPLPEPAKTDDTPRHRSHHARTRARRRQVTS
jgi:S1-C subfamily serine protease